MNSRIFTVIAVVGFSLLAGLYVTISVISGGGNEIGKLAVYLSAGCFVFGLCFNRAAMYLLVFLAAYSDLIKRIMVLGSSVSYMDLVYVLAMAPLTLAGVVVSVFFRKTIGGGFAKNDLVRFLICVIVFMLVGGSAVLSGQGLGSLRVVADYGVFIFLIYVLPILFVERDDLLRYAKTVIYIFLPVALYGLWQRFYGLSDFELDYLATGLSREARQFDELVFRPFSTLNAASSLTVVMAACTMICWILMRNKVMHRFAGFSLMLIFILTSYATLSRTGWVCIILAPAAIFCVRYKLTTALGYLMVLVGLVLMVVFSDWALDNLQDWQADITGVEDHGASTQALRITTMSDRFVGFSNLKNPDNWKPFGVETSKYYGDSARDSSTYSHDLITGFIFRRGYVPAAVVFVILVIILMKVHMRVLSQPIEKRKLTAVAVGSCAALLASVVVGGTSFSFQRIYFSGLWFLFAWS